MKMDKEERDGRIDATIDDAMRMGAALGNWTKTDQAFPPRPDTARAAVEAMDAARKVFVEHLIYLANIQFTPEADEREKR